jgi:hypothetical protein
VERGVTLSILCIKDIACKDFSSTYTKTLSCDPLNPEHEAIGQVSWVDYTTCKYALAFSARGLRLRVIIIAVEVIIEIMLSCFLMSNHGVICIVNSTIHCTKKERATKA